MSLRHLLSPEQRAVLKAAIEPRNTYGSGGGYIVASKRMIAGLVKLELAKAGTIPTTGWLTLVGYDIAQKSSKPLRPSIISNQASEETPSVPIPEEPE